MKVHFAFTNIEKKTVPRKLWVGSILEVTLETRFPELDNSCILIHSGFYDK